MNEWSLVYDRFDPLEEGLRESLCTLGNGYFATRGAACESSADDVHYPGTYVAGCYDRLTTRIAGRAVENEDLVNVPNWLPLTFRLPGGRWFDLSDVEVLDFRQELDLRRGILIRKVRFGDADGRLTGFTQRRLVSMRDPHVAGIQMSIVPENWSGRLEVRTGLDGGVRNAGVPRYRALRGDHLTGVTTGRVDPDIQWLEAETRGSRIRIAEAARTRVFRDGEPVRAERRIVDEPGRTVDAMRVEVESGVPVTIEKLVSLFTSRDPAIYEPAIQARVWVDHVGRFDEVLEAHIQDWARLWSRFDVRIEGPPRSQEIVRLHAFHVLQTVSENTIGLDAGVPARGLHGEAYRGHVFWDEVFILPYLNLRLPILARMPLEYRYRRLPEARWAAAQAGYRGAMFPWQSGSDGREETQVVHLNPRSGRWLPDHSHLQRHINIAIAYNAWHHWQAVGDVQFLRFRLAPLIIEIARFWASIATHDPGLDRYVVRGVMGPDEYHDSYPGAEEAGVDNNAYTNVMAAWVLCRALEILDGLPDHYRTELRDSLGLSADELDLFERVSRAMYVPFHDGVISQFDGYADLEELDWLDYRERYGDIQRLDRILEAEGDSTNRYKVSKQADVLMLFYLLPDDELRDLLDRLGYRFAPDADIPRNVEYYLRRTSDGSTLSRLVTAWVLARWDRGRSWDFFSSALESDISDVQGGSTREGIHLGAMAGTLDLVQRVYAGAQIRDGVLWLDPRLPEQTSALALSLHYRGQRLDIEIEGRRLRVAARPGTSLPISLGLAGTVVELAPGRSCEIELGGRPGRRAPAGRRRT